MLTHLRTLLSRWFGLSFLMPTRQEDLPVYAPHTGQAGKGLPVPYDEQLLEKARAQWLAGEWELLAQLDRDTLQHHPDRAKLALLAAAGRLQTGENLEAKSLIRLAQDWGCSKTLMSQILIGGVHYSLGRAASVGGQEERALRHFGEGVGKWNGLGDIQSLSYYHKPTSSFILTGQHQVKTTARAEYLNQNGETLYEEGKYKMAVEYFQRALDLTPDNAWICQNLAEAVARLPFKKGDQWEVEQLAETIDETGKWDVAVRHYRRALKLDSAKVQEHHHAQHFVIEPVQEGQIDNPIFIVGCGHSGTSLMLAILGAHPRINPIPKESALFLRSDADIQKTLGAWDADCHTQGKARWVEKTPPHIFQIHRFLAIRPKSRIIIMLRDGRDVVCSLKPRIGYAAFEDRLDRWVYDNLAGLPWWTHPQVKRVKYEDLVAQSEATLQTICQFLGEEYNPQMLDYHKTEHRWYSDQIVKPDAIKTHSDHKNNRNWQINQPIFDGRGRWQAEMTKAEKEMFKNSPAQALLEQFGYVNNSSW